MLAATSLRRLRQGWRNILRQWLERHSPMAGMLTTIARYPPHRLPARCLPVTGTLPPVAGVSLVSRRSITGSRRAGSSICPVSTGKSGANGTLPAVGPRTSHGSSLRPPRKMVAPVPCRRALRLLRPAWHGFALRVPARLCLRLFQALPATAQSTATGAPRPLLYPRGNRKIPPPENFGAWGAVCTRAIPPSATLLRRRR